MGFLINFLLISGLSFIIVETTTLFKLETEILGLFSNGFPSVGVTEGNRLKLLNGGAIAMTKKALVWKGIYDDKIEVACKIAVQKDEMNREMEVFEALNATRDPNIEEHDIPRIHFHGKILDKYDAIVMSLFEETLANRYIAQNKNLSDLSILMIFKKAVKGLQYLNEKHVVHNDIKPNNIFLRGNKVFLGDFDLASLNGLPSMGFNEMFVSSNFFLGLERTAKDDLESLIYTILYIANVPMGRFNQRYKPEGFIFASLNRKAKESRMLEKCEHFKNEHVYEAMKLICADELISRDSVPNYKRIIDALTDAIDKIKGSSHPPRFEWLTDDGTAESSRI